MPTKKLLSTILFSLLFTLKAGADDHVTVNYFWSCFLPQGTMFNCDDLSRGFRDSATYAHAVDSVGQADLILSVSFLTVKDVNYYVLEFLGAGKLPKFTANVKLPNELTIDNARFRIMKAFEEAMDGYSRILKLVRGGLIEDPAPSSLAPAKKWFASPGVMTSLSEGSIGMISGSGSVSATYADPKWKVQNNYAAFYQKMSISIPGQPNIVGEAFTFGGGSIISYTIDGGWSVAGIVGYARSPGSNLKADISEAVGVEWTLVPYMKTQEQNIAIEYLVGGEHQVYFSPNILDESRSSVLYHSLSIYFAWQMADGNLNLNLGGGVSSPVSMMEYGKANANLSVTYRLSESATLSAGFSLRYQDKFLYQPLNPDFNNPLQTYVSGSNYAKISYSATLGLNFFFGNSRLSSEDQRWRHTN